MLNNQKGMALIIVFIMTTVIVLIGGAALSLGSTVRKNAVTEVHQSRAYYAAEAGVEKALAEAKNNCVWLKNTVPTRSKFTNSEDNSEDEKFIYDTHYPGINDESMIEMVRIIKTSVDEKNNVVYVKISSMGKSFQSRKTITVDAKIVYAYPELLFKGIWTNYMSTLPKGHGVDIDCSIYVSGEGLTIPADSDITGDIFCNGRVLFKGGNKNKSTIVNGDIYAAAGVTIEQYMQLYGNIYVSDASSVIYGEEGVIHNGQIIVCEQQTLLSKMPPSVPDMFENNQLTWYKDNANFTSIPGDLNFQNGIYFINGNLSLSGSYTGQATIVVNGDVEFTGNFVRKETIDNTYKPVSSSCLTILSTNTIRTQNATDKLEVYLYSKNNVYLKNKTDITGGIISSSIAEINGSIVHVQESKEMLDAYKSFLTNTTNFIEILKWIN